jgi:hypothetical protein
MPKMERIKCVPGIRIRGSAFRGLFNQGCLAPTKGKDAWHPSLVTKGKDAFADISRRMI